MKKVLVSLIVGGSLFLSPFSQAISRIGGGKVSSDRSLFVADLPMQYQEMSSGKPGGLKVYMLPYGSYPGQPFAGTIVMGEFSDIYPDMSTSSRTQLKNVFVSEQGYQNVNMHFKIPMCVDIYYKPLNSTHQYIVVWGGGRGFQLAFTNDGQTRYAGLNILRSLELEEGACAWN